MLNLKRRPHPSLSHPCEPYLSWFVCVCVCVCACVSLSRVRLFATTMNCSPPGSSVHGYWNGLPFPSLGDLPDPGMEPGSPALLADPLPSELLGEPWFGSGISHRSWGISQSSKQAIFLSGLTNEK